MSANRPELAAIDGLSHVRDTAEGVPLWRRTIPAVFAETVAAHGPREAVVFRQHGERWT